jgi:hypothetical protein
MKLKLKLHFLFIFFLCAADIIKCQGLYFPEKGEWQKKRPEELGVSSELLKKAVQFAESNETPFDHDLRIANYKAYANNPYYEIVGPIQKRGALAGLIIKNGYIIAQWGDVNRVDMTFSVTKCYLSTVAGLAWDTGLIKDLNDKVADYVWDGKFDGEHNSKITWEHLLSQTSDWSGTLFGMYDWADQPPKDGNIDTLKNRTLFKPGTHFEYNDVRVNLLAYSLLQVFRTPLPMVLKEKIMDKIDASSTWRWYGYDNSFVNVDGIMMQSVSGGGHYGGGLFINTLDQARFGLLFLNKGRWKDQQLISEKWINLATKPTKINAKYGFMWSIFNDSAYFAEGFGGNFIIISTEYNLLVVIRWIDYKKTEELMNMILKSIKQK